MRRAALLPAIPLLAASFAAPLAAGDHPQPIENSPSGIIAFDHKGGNEWWVETAIGPIQPTRVLAQDEGQDEGGAWKELTFRSWGVWAGSLHVEPGHEVRFRALVESKWRESCWFTHPQGMSPDGQQVCQGTEPGE